MAWMILGMLQVTTNSLDFSPAAKEPKHALVPKDKPCTEKVHGFFFVGYTGFEPVTSALSRQRSKPTELIALSEIQRYEMGVF